MLKERLTEDMKAAMKAGDAFTLGVVRMTIAALDNKAIEKRGKGLPEGLSEEEELEVIAKEAKRRDDAAKLYEEGGRADLAAAERKEQEFLARYLPKQMTEEEVAEAVKAIAAANPGADFPIVMRAAMAELKGKADGAIVGAAVKDLLKR